MYLLKLTIDIWNTATPNKFQIQQNAHIPRPPPPIDHRCMEYCYTESVSHIAESTYTKGPPPTLTIDI